MDMSVLHKISYGLFVVTAEDYEKPNGCIINTAMQVTDNPLQISITIQKANLTHDFIKNTGIFNISTISEDADFSLFRHFGFQKGRQTHKFENFRDAAKSENGLYYITRGCNSYISAKVVNSVDLGTHTAFIAEVTDGEVLSTVPSATYAYYHSNIKPQPQKPAKSGYRCKICGYLYEGEEIPSDFVCPLCGHGIVDFEKVTV